MPAEKMKPLLGDHHETLRHVTGLMHEVIRAIGGDISVSQLLIFMEVARSNAAGHAIDMKELQILIGITSGSTFSRQVAALLEYQKEGVQGLGLLEQIENPRDRRRKQLLLTDKGANVREVLAAFIKRDEIYLRKTTPAIEPQPTED